jgi:hypothetical protein
MPDLNSRPVGPITMYSPYVGVEYSHTRNASPSSMLIGSLLFEIRALTTCSGIVTTESKRQKTSALSIFPLESRWRITTSPPDDVARWKISSLVFVMLKVLSNAKSVNEPLIKPSRIKLASSPNTVSGLNASDCWRAFKERAKGSSADAANGRIRIRIEACRSYLHDGVMIKKIKNLTTSFRQSPVAGNPFRCFWNQTIRIIERNSLKRFEEPIRQVPVVFNTYGLYFDFATVGQPQRKDMLVRRSIGEVVLSLNDDALNALSGLVVDRTDINGWISTAMQPEPFLNLDNRINLLGCDGASFIEDRQSLFNTRGNCIPEERATSLQLFGDKNLMVPCFRGCDGCGIYSRNLCTNSFAHKFRLSPVGRGRLFWGSSDFWGGPPDLKPGQSRMINWANSRLIGQKPLFRQSLYRVWLSMMGVF